MMEMTIISIMVEEEVDVKQLSSLRKMFLIKMSLKEIESQKIHIFNSSLFVFADAMKRLYRYMVEYEK